MPSQFICRILRPGPTWGIYVELWAEVATVAPEAAEADGTHWIAPWLFLRYDGAIRISEEERGCLYCGMHLAAHKIAESRQEGELLGRSSGKVLLVRVTDLTFNDCDYQPEGLTCAMAGWAAQQFGFTLPVVSVIYNLERNRYEFDFAAFTPSEQE